jgi:hypothetical protein
MLKIKAISKVLMVLIFIQLVIVSVYAENCFNPVTGISQDVSDDNSSEYILKFNFTNESINQNFNFVRNSNNSLICNNKRFVLVIDDNESFKITGTNKEIKISGAIDEVRFDSNSQNPITLTFLVDNNESQLVGDNTPGVFNIDVNETRVLTNTKIVITEGERDFIESNGNASSPNRVGRGVRLNLRNLIVENNADLNISLQAITPNSGGTYGTYEYNNNIFSTQHGMHGGTALFVAENILNNGKLNIDIFSAPGSKGRVIGDDDILNILGANGGDGGRATFYVNNIYNYKDLNINVRSGNGADGSNGTDEGSLGGGLPMDGGVAGFGGQSDLYINDNLYNFINGVININVLSGSGGNGGNAGRNTFWSDNANGGNGGFGGFVFFNYGTGYNINIHNQGQLNYNVITGDSGFGGTKTKSGRKGSSGAGGDIFDFNVSRFVNTGDFNYYALGGKVNINNDYIGTGRAGNIGSINIENLNNFSQNFNINIELNEKNIENISSITCACQENCSIVGDPKIGNININYLKPGSFLPRSLKIIKQVPINDTTINISGCYVLSSGNSSISYAADNLILKLSNLADIQYDFDESENMTANNIFEKIVCPVCDSLELNNFALRTDIEYTIYTDQGTENITDLNIYYVNPDGSLFKPPGYPSNKDYVIYSLKTGETITPKQNQFIGTNIKEYKIAKEKLHYNSENFDLTNIPIKKGYDTQDVRLFCQAQRYLLRFKLENQSEIKEIYFTPLFDIK